MDRIRTEVQMDDPIFAPGQVKTAVVTLVVKPIGLDISLKLWLGPNPSTQSVVSSLAGPLSTGLSQVIRIDITMPTGAGTYNVYLDVKVALILMAAYVGTEAVIIPSTEVTSLSWA